MRIKKTVSFSVFIFFFLLSFSGSSYAQLTSPHDGIEPSFPWVCFSATNCQSGGIGFEVHQQEDGIFRCDGGCDPLRDNNTGIITITDLADGHSITLECPSCTALIAADGSIRINDGSSGQFWDWVGRIVDIVK
ncbi:hypothetical protein [Microbulbifer spongiae]|uniref:Uncharacterized protein n=1 Tax=Microbulbifer spongiae TaxID=2944933 RepID=A0ABY9EG75_9GAMM|nr:hypothetical protein [Microbulbifer sp. MI-G]WKD51687.1 hypothetical protein M8T91_18705 [Microbulbifer sp. MI-G]